MTTIREVIKNSTVIIPALRMWRWPGFHTAAQLCGIPTLSRQLRSTSYGRERTIQETNKLIAKPNAPARMQNHTERQYSAGAFVFSILPPLFRGMVPILMLNSASAHGRTMKNWKGLTKNWTKNLLPNFHVSTAIETRAARTSQAAGRRGETPGPPSSPLGRPSGSIRLLRLTNQPSGPVER